MQGVECLISLDNNIPDYTPKVNENFLIYAFSANCTKNFRYAGIFYKVAKTTQNARFSQLFENKIGQIWSRFFLEKLRETLFFAVKHCFLPLKSCKPDFRICNFFRNFARFLALFCDFSNLQKGG